MSAHILIVEDERKTAGYLRRGLTENGYQVELAGDGDLGLKRALAKQFDLLILDVMLPLRDGWSVLTELRRVGNPVPVLFLTARDDVRDRVKGLNLGADDYLVKPFAFSELMARIQTVMRRSAGTLPEMLHIANMEIDLAHQRVSRDGERIDLTPKEFALLALLARSRSKPFSRATIAREVWDMEYEGASNLVDVHVRRLRAKIDDPYEPKLLHTVRGVGYVVDHR